MRDETVARSYAETLFELAGRHEGVEAFGAGIQSVADMIEGDRAVREFFKTPRISAAEKKAVLESAMGGAMPAKLVTFLKVTIDKRRQRLIPEIAKQYGDLVDGHLGRSHVDVTVARPLDAAATSELATRLSEVTGKTVIPHVHVRPEILGGIVIREGDTVYDGSVKRQLDRMRRTLLGAELPTPAPAG